MLDNVKAALMLKRPEGIPISQPLIQALMRKKDATTEKRHRA